MIQQRQKGLTAYSGCLTQIMVKCEDGAHHGITQILVVIAPEMHHKETQQIRDAVCHRLPVVGFTFPGIEFSLRTLGQLLTQVAEEFPQQLQIAAIATVSNERIQMTRYIGQHQLRVIAVRVKQIIVQQRQRKSLDGSFGEVILI